MRSPSICSEVRINPSFLRTTPAKKPRTEGCCQPVAFMMVAIVAPLDCLSSASTASCLVPLRVEPARISSDLSGLFARLLPRAGLVFLGVLLCDILGSFVGCDGTTRRHHRSPAV